MTKRLADMTDEEKERHYEYVRQHKKNIREVNRKWRENHRERARELSRKYYSEHRDQERKRKREQAKDARSINPERSRAACKKWREAHPDRALEASRKWRELYPDRARENVRKWAAKNSEHERARCATYRARSLGNGGKCTADEWRFILDKYGHKCLCCGKSNIKLTRDHVLPVVLGGSGYPGNLQPLCLNCNSSKGDHYIDYRPDSYFADWT